jgi:hypothetical protein
MSPMIGSSFHISVVSFKINKVRNNFAFWKFFNLALLKSLTFIIYNVQIAVYDNFIIFLWLLHNKIIVKSAHKKTGQLNRDINYYPASEHQKPYLPKKFDLFVTNYLF